MPTRGLRALRFLSASLLLLALGGLALDLPSRDGTVIVVCDRSASMPGDADASEKEAIGLIVRRMGPEDLLGVVSFGRQTVTDRPPQQGKFGGFDHDVGRDASHLADALQRALELIPRDAPGRILILSDGRWTGRDPFGVASWAAARDVAIDYRALERPRTGDLAVDRIDAPATVAPGESFLVTAWVQAPTAQEVTYELRSGDRVVASGKQAMGAGLNRLTFRDRAAAPGNLSYELKIEGGENDPVPGNNRARLLVGVSGPRPLLHVAASKDSGLAKLLTAGGLRLDVKTPAECRWGLDDLARYSAVLLENVPAEKVGTAGMENLNAWVRQTGTGLMMTGGRSSYGPGGYYKSPIDPLLPVSMELRNEHRKLSLAIVVALDRSGSMALPVAGGQVKMDLANAGTAQVLDMLSPIDELGVLAVDELAHVITDIGPVPQDKGGLRRQILGIQSMGGGIFVYEALSKASAMLLRAKAGTKHIILFSDAADSEEPGRYQELLEKLRGAGITVSVIGLGKRTDRDGALLEDIAKLGRGRCFFTDRAEDLPRLFAQDTLVVARNTFIDEPTPIRATAGLVELTGRDLAVAKSVGGYNLAYLKPEARLATVTLDEYRAPLVSSWRA